MNLLPLSFFEICSKLKPVETNFKTVYFYLGIGIGPVNLAYSEAFQKIFLQYIKFIGK